MITDFCFEFSDAITPLASRFSPSGANRENKQFDSFSHAHYLAACTVIRGMYKRNSFVKFTLMKKEWLRSLISIRKCTFIMPIPKTPSYADILRSRYYTFSLRSASSKEPPPSLALPGSNPTASSAALRVAVLLFVLPDPPKPNDIGLSSLH
jgi:hypothetical protein